MPALSSSIATNPHEGILRDAVIALKYRGTPHLAATLGQRILQTIGADIARYDLVVAVPMHARRQAQRGFNQAALLAHTIAQQTNLIDASDKLLQVRATRPQVGLNAAERRTNLQGAFTASPTAFRGQRILLVDDVQTTGTTLSTCATILHTAGANFITGITLTDASLRLKN